MENIPVFGQTVQLLASGIILLALCLGVIFYFWSVDMCSKIELLTTSMKRNIYSLENLSQLIYEKAYSELEKETKGMYREQKVDSRLSSDNSDAQYANDESKTFSPIKNIGSDTKFSSLHKESEKYQEISKLILKSLKDLLEEKEQVTAQELFYAIPNKYPLADVYQTLEEMKERNQIDWEDKNVSPQSVLKYKMNK